MLNITELIKVARGASVSEMLSAAHHQKTCDALVEAPLHRGPGRDVSVTLDFGCSCDLGALHGLAAAAVDSAAPPTTDERLRFIEEFARADAQALIFAGEPFRSPDIIELLARAGALGLAPRIITRGDVFDSFTARPLADMGVAYVGVELDWDPALSSGQPQLHQPLRRALRTYERARATGLPVGVHIRLTVENTLHLRELLGLAKAVRAPRVYLQHTWGTGCGCIPVQARPDVATVRATLLAMFEEADTVLRQRGDLMYAVGDNDSDGALLVRWITRRYGVTTAARVFRILEHYAGFTRYEHHLVVNAAGWCRSTSTPSGLPLGTLRRRPLHEIIERPLPEYLADRTARFAGHCAACRWAPVCRGVQPDSGPSVGDRDPTCVIEAYGRHHAASYQHPPRAH